MIVRKNIYSLSNDEFGKFVAAIKAVKNTGDYNELIQLHASSINAVHRKPMFLPWHRAFLLRFEELLQEAMNDPTFGLPYWDWTNDVGSPNQIGKLWAAGMMGGTGRSGVTDGPFVASQWITISPNGEFGSVLERNLGGTGQPVTTTSDVLRLFRADQYDSFRTGLESGPHDTMHRWVGGQMASVPNSPNDPVFFLHHANNDRIWAQWQQLYPNVPTTAPGMNPTTVMPPTEPGVPGATVGSVIDAPFSRYAYDGFYIADVNWGDDALIPDPHNAYGVSGSPALAAFGVKLYCVRQGRGNSGWTWCG
ncbi:tyrosinase family protein, partial [uncultured Bradyrhizobium sp.]|uniref:tyrosinase family protein n=1 Tax=uncultured Bradyrhizobium sp. TaxID=199684 RepID=UPI0035CACD68